MSGRGQKSQRGAVGGSRSEPSISSQSRNRGSRKNKEVCPVCRIPVSFLKRHCDERHLPWFVHAATACAVCSMQVLETGPGCVVKHSKVKHPEVNGMLRPIEWGDHMKRFFSEISRVVGLNNLWEIHEFVVKHGLGLGTGGIAKHGGWRIPHEDKMYFTQFGPLERYDPGVPKYLSDCLHWKIVCRLIAVSSSLGCNFKHLVNAEKPGDNTKPVHRQPGTPQGQDRHMTARANDPKDLLNIPNMPEEIDKEMNLLMQVLEHGDLSILPPEIHLEDVHEGLNLVKDLIQGGNIPGDVEMMLSNLGQARGPVVQEQSSSGNSRSDRRDQPPSAHRESRRRGHESDTRGHERNSRGHERDARRHERDSRGHERDSPSRRKRPRMDADLPRQSLSSVDYDQQRYDDRRVRDEDRQQLSRGMNVPPQRHERSPSDLLEIERDQLQSGAQTVRRDQYDQQQPERTYRDLPRQQEESMQRQPRSSHDNGVVKSKNDDYQHHQERNDDVKERSYQNRERSYERTLPEMSIVNRQRHTESALYDPASPSGERESFTYPEYGRNERKPVEPYKSRELTEGNIPSEERPYFASDHGGIVSDMEKKHAEYAKSRGPRIPYQSEENPSPSPYPSSAQTYHGHPDYRDVKRDNSRSDYNRRDSREAVVENVMIPGVSTRDPYNVQSVSDKFMYMQKGAPPHVPDLMKTAVSKPSYGTEYDDPIRETAKPSPGYPRKNLWTGEIPEALPRKIPQYNEQKMVPNMPGSYMDTEPTTESMHAAKYRTSNESAIYPEFPNSEKARYSEQQALSERTWLPAKEAAPRYSTSVHDDHGRHDVRQSYAPPSTDMEMKSLLNLDPKLPPARLEEPSSSKQYQHYSDMRGQLPPQYRMPPPRQNASTSSPPTRSAQPLPKQPGSKQNRTALLDHLGSLQKSMDVLSNAVKLMKQNK